MVLYARASTHIYGKMSISFLADFDQLEKPSLEVAPITFRLTLLTVSEVCFSATSPKMVFSARISLSEHLSFVTLNFDMTLTYEVDLDRVNSR